MLIAQCNGYRIMKPSVFTLVPYKHCDYAVLSAKRKAKVIGQPFLQQTKFDSYLWKLEMI